MKLSPYLGFNGNCREAFAFYNEVLGGEIVMMMTHEDVPASERMSPDWNDMIMHARLVIGDVVIMGGDTPPDYYTPTAGIHISLIVDGPEEATRIFNAFADGGTVRMPLMEMFYSPLFGMVVDKYGTPWMINGGEKTF